MSAAAPTISADAQKSRQTAAREQADENAGQSRNEEGHWRPVLGLPCQLTVELPLPHFKVADFLGLRPGSVLETSWRLAHDVPLRVNGTLIAWAELEGTGNQLAVRLTELA